jgi:hypothetical protein
MEALETDWLLAGLVIGEYNSSKAQTSCSHLLQICKEDNGSFFPPNSNTSILLAGE